MICRPWLNRVLMMNAAHAARVVMPALARIVLHRVQLCVVRHWVATPRLPMAATSLLRPLVPMQTNPPLSASAR